MSELAGQGTLDVVEETGPPLLWEGFAAMFATPDGGRVIRYEQNGEEKFIGIPAELVPALGILSENPGVLMNISRGPLGAMMRKRVRKMTEGLADGNVPDPS
jgi:hypothetical protein